MTTSHAKCMLALHEPLCVAFALERVSSSSESEASFKIRASWDFSFRWSGVLLCQTSVGTVTDGNFFWTVIQMATPSGVLARPADCRPSMTCWT